LPYIPKVTNAITSGLDNDVFTIGIRVINKLNNIIKVHKDNTEKMQRNNVVYKVECNNCDSSYVGQTKRKLITRVKEHKYNIRANPTRVTVLSEHCNQFGHFFDWDNIRIMAIESHHNKRLISEMLFIKEQNNGINAQKDTEKLDGAYGQLFRSLPSVCK
ncbi:hypothetical protein ALC62_05841, partial [Cyphomyrmex costatus]